jgi:6-phosphogluconate dehydrogenase
MDGNMAERLRLGGHQVVGFDYNPEAVARLTAAGSLGVPSLQEMVQKPKGRKAIWIMVPQGNPVDETIAKLEPLLSPGDIMIDGGNSNYNDTIRRHKEISARGFSFLAVGTSGGVWGLKEGYSMMIGGEKETVDYLRPIFETLAPAADKGRGASRSRRLRSLCQDGPQRYRVRTDAGVRRGLHHP